MKSTFIRKNVLSVNLILKKTVMLEKLKTIGLFAFLLIQLFGYSQGENKIDSLTTIYNNLEDNKQKIKLGHQLFKLAIYEDKTLAKQFAEEQLALSKAINYTKGVGTAYRDLAKYYRYASKPDSARYYFKASVKNFTENGNKERLCTALDRFATFEVTQGNFNKALELVEQMIDIAKELKNGKIITEALQRLSVIYLDMAEFANAMQVTLKSIEVADSMTPKYIFGKAVGLSDIGRIEIHRNNYSQAIEPTKEALQLFKDIEDTKWQAIVLNQLGNAYWHLKDYDASLNTYQESLRIVTALKRQDYVAVALSNMAGIYSKKGEYKKAIQMIEEAQDITLKIGTVSNIINNYGMIGDIHLEHKKNGKAIQNYSEAINVAESVNALDDLYTMYQSRSNAYEKRGNYKNALYDYKTFKVLYDSIFNTESDRYIEELKTKYDLQKKENEIIIKENKIKLLEERKQRAENERLFFIITGLGILAFAISMIYGLRQKMKRNKIEREKLDIDLKFKEKQLTTHALHLAHKNEVLLDLKQQIKSLKTDSNNSRSFQNIINNINLDISNDNNWEQFKTYFEDVHRDFNSKVMKSYPEISNNDLRLMSLLKMNLSTKEIANILNISTEGVKKARYRLRKKLNLSTEDSLQELVISM